MPSADDLHNLSSLPARKSQRVRDAEAEEFDEDDYYYGEEEGAVSRERTENADAHNCTTLVQSLVECKERKCGASKLCWSFWCFSENNLQK